MTLRKRKFGLLVLLLVLVLIMSACGGDDDTEEDNGDNENPTPLPSSGTEAPETPDETPEASGTEEPSSAEPNTASGVTTLVSAPVAVNAAADTSGDSVPVRSGVAQDITDATGSLLVWAANAPAPGQHTADQPGEIGYLDREGNYTYLLNVPQQANSVVGCGEALSENGQYYMLYMGLDTRLGGTLYLVSDAGVPQVFAENVQLLSCRGGSGILQYGPDNSYAAYIAYEPGSGEAGSDFATGSLILDSLPAGDEMESFDNAVSFDVAADGVAFVQFYTNNQDEADEVAISWWDGDRDSEIATINAGEDCRFVSAYVQVGPDSQVWTVLGEDCPDTDLTWQLYRTSADKSNALLVHSVNVGNLAMAPYAQINNLLFTPDNQTLLYTLPDGLALNSGSLNAANVNELTRPRTLLNRGMVLPYFAPTENAAPQISPDGRWWAMVVQSPGEPVKLVIYELSNLETDPYTIETGDGDIIPWFAFAPNSESLFYISGGKNGGDNALSRFSLLEGTDERLERGTYTGWATLSPDGNEIAVLEWVEVPQGVRPTNIDFYTNLELINIAEGDVTTIVEGGQINGDQLENVRFVKPLVWLSR